MASTKKSAVERLREMNDKKVQGSVTGSASSAVMRLRAMQSANAEKNSSTTSSALQRLRNMGSEQKPTLTSAAQIYARGNTSSAVLKNGPSGTPENGPLGTPVPTEEGSKNRGGLLGGVGYVGEKITLGTVQGIEGVFDTLIGGAADLFGADDFAERQFANDWFNYSHADEWYNPGEGWKVAGDVAGGIGSSIPGIATAAAITYFTGGVGAGLGATLVAGTSAAGTSVKEAYQETGELTGKEWGYGALSGATEGLIEYATAGIGAGTAAIGKRIGQAFGKTAAKEVGKTTVKSVAVDLGKDFLSEAFEEGISELMSPQYKKLTYDPSAKNATAGEVAYAALVGGLSGILTSGAGTTVTQGANIRRGAKAEASGSVGRIKAISEVVLEADGARTDEQSINAVRELYRDITEGSLKITEGEKLSIAQKRALGELQQANMAALFQPKMVQAAANAISNAEAVVERLNSYGNIKVDKDGRLVVTGEDTSSTASGPPSPAGEGLRDITAKDLRAGFDEKGGKQALAKAIQNNEVLRYVAASDVAGRLIMSVEQFEKTALEGTNIKNQVDLNKFIEEASPEKRRALGRELGIAENEWDTLQLGRLNEAVRSYRESGKAEAYKSRMEAVNKAKSVDESAAKKKIPSTIRLGDGKVERYKTDKVDIAVYRNGDSFVVYDYNENAPSRALSRAEVNSVLEQMRNGESAADVAKTLKTAENAELTSMNRENVQVSDDGEPIPASARRSKETVDTSSTADAVPLPPLGKASGESSSEKTSKERVAEVKERIEAKKIDEYLRENVEDYDGLKEADKSMIRKVVREGRVYGLEESDILSYARVAAHTGINIEYDANMKNGDAGYYDPKANKIVVNPKAEKKQELILIHELDHAVRKLVDLGGNVHTLVYEGAEKGLSKETWEQIKKDYAEQDVDVTREELLADEASAYYTEAILGGKATVDLLIGKEPSLAKKILNFFTGAARAYSKDEKLSRAARRHYKSFKAMFDAFAKANRGRNAETAVEGGKTNEAAQRKSFSSIAQTFYGNPTMSTKEFLKGNYREQIGYKKYVEQCLNNYKQTRPDLDEATARREIEDAIGGIVEVAVAAKNAGYDIFDDAAKREVKDSKKRLLFSSLEPNSDYFTSSDISTICDKRINFAEIYDDIVRKEEALGVPRGKRFFDNVDNYFYIHKVLADKGLTQPCKECYVESMRKNLAPMATSFLELINEADADNKSNKLLWANGKLKENNAKLRERVRDVLMNEYGTDPSELTVEDVSTEKGLAQLKITMPLVYEAFNSFYGQAKPKMPRAATPFRFGELTALLTDNKGKISKSLVDRINKTGGFRLQSYSDFQTQNFVDVLQTIFEAGSLGLKGHAYTKVPAFLDATAGTNLKRNISIFMYKDGDQWRIDKNDSFPMSLEDIYKVVKADKSGNTGIIAVSQNAEMSAWIMANDDIAYGIPFHKSGLKMKVVRDTVVKEDGREIKGYTGTKDHTKQQTEVWKSDQRNEKGEVVYKKGTKVKEGVSIYDGFWDFENKDGLSKRDLIRKNLEAYIDECEKRDYIPKFREYLVDNAKVLEDTLAYAKQLGFAKADATVDDISFKYKGYTVPYGYYKFLGDYTMFTADGKASAAEVLSLKDYDFKKAVKYFSDAEALRREEILRQFANGTERDKYRASTMTAGELENIVKLKRDEVVGEIVSKSIRRSTDYAASLDQLSKGTFDGESKDIRYAKEIKPELAEGSVTERYKAHLLEKLNGARAEEAKRLAPRIKDMAKNSRGRASEYHLEGIKVAQNLNFPDNEIVLFSGDSIRVYVYREGDSYIVYDEDAGEVTRFLSKEELEDLGDALIDRDQAGNGSRWIASEEAQLLMSDPDAYEKKYGAENERRKNEISTLKDLLKYGGVSGKGLLSRMLVVPDASYETKITERSANSGAILDKKRTTLKQPTQKPIKKTPPRKITLELPKVKDEGGKVESVMGRDARVGARRASVLSNRRADMTVGQIRQMVARYSGEKVYTSKEARETIDNIAGIFTLSQKNRAKLYEAMWQGYNACKTDNERAEFSYDMAEYVTMMLLTESSVENPDRAGTMETLSKLKSGIGHLTFNDSQRADLRHALDKTGYKRFIGRWGFRETMHPNRRRVALDVFLHNLGEENPEFAYLKDMTPQDAIIELDRIYERTIEDSKAVIGLLDDVPDSELRYMIDDLGTAIYESFSTKGEKSTVEKIIEARLASAERKYAKLKSKYDELERKYIEEQGRPRKLLNLSYQIQKMKNLQLGTFLNSTDYNNEVFKQTFEILGSIEFRGNISPAKVRTAMKRLAKWYTAENPVLAEMPGEPGSKLYTDWIALQINAIAEGNGGLTNFELDQLDIILQHATKIVENFNRVWKGGKWVDAETTAKSYIGVAEEASLIRVKSGSYRKVRKMLDNLSRRYFLSFGDPMSVFRYMDGYMPGFYTEMGEELRQGAFRYQVDMMEMKTEYDKFLKGNKKYLKDTSTKALEYAGVKMTKLQFMSLYMTMQRGQAVRGLAENGFSLIDVNGRRVEADGFLERVQKRLGAEAGIEKDPDGNWKVSAEQLEAATKAEIAEMKKKLSKTDLEFIGVIESTLNGRCKDLKRMRDMERLGFSNTIEGYYYPIVRAMIAKNIDTKGMWGEIDRASNISANKDTVKGAKGALWIESADTVFNRHIDAVARYAELSPVIDSINKIFNLDVSGNKNRPRSVRTATFNAWQTDKIFGGAVADGQKHAGEAYLKELLADVQGIGKDVGVGERFVNGLRGRFAIAALSANPKVLATQFSSVFASTSIISMKDITAGSRLAFDKNADSDVDKYCPIAKLRNYDSSAAKAQGVIDNISGVGEKLMWGVGFMDRQVVKTVWGGAQANIERTMGHKVGTEENKIEAGKLLEKIIFETQQNSVATEKSSAMRSKSAFMKTLTMFTSDAMKNIGRVIDGLGRVSALKQRIKNAKAKGDNATVSKLQKELKGANEQARAAIGALAMNAVYMTLIARLFSHLYAKEDEEEGWKPLAFISETFGNMLGGLPVFSDVYDFFTNGYEISDSVYDTINDVLAGTKKVASVAADVADGKATSADVNGALMSFLQVTGTALGLPVRNARNMGMGLVRRFAPNAAYRLEMVTKDKNFASDFNEAIEAGDDSKASMILGLLLSERLGDTGERTVGDAGPYRTEILRMSRAGYNVLPRTIGDSVTIGGEEVIMYPEEQAALRARYSEAVGVIETLIASEAYAALGDEQRESAIRFIYDVYYDRGIYELYGYERNMKRRLFAKVLSPDKLALAAVMTAGLESDYEDEKGKVVSEDKWAAIRGTTARVNYTTVSGSKRKKVIAAISKLPLSTAEKLLIIAYKGYTIKDGDVRGYTAERAKKTLSSYAKKAGLTGDEAKALEGYL